MVGAENVTFDSVPIGLSITVIQGDVCVMATHKKRESRDDQVPGRCYKLGP
jgi:hypothetical protein